MSAEILLQASIAFATAGARIDATFAGTYFDVAGTAGIQNVNAVGTSDETLPLGDISTIGWVYLKNLDATNYITGISADGTTLKVIGTKSGEFFLGRWNAAAIHVKANTAPCNLESIILPD